MAAEEGEAAPDPGISVREHIEGRLDRVAREGDERLLVLQRLYDEKIGAVHAEVSALKELVGQRHSDQEKALDAALAAQKGAVETALTAQKEAVATALAAVAKENMLHAEAHEREHRAQALAVEKMEQRFNEKHEDGNRFREQIEGERLLYVRRDMLDLAERNNRENLEKLEDGFRLRMEKLEADERAGLSKVENDLRQRIEVEAALRAETFRPLLTWQARTSGQVAVWVAVAGVGVTLVISVVVFLANYLTAR